MSGILGRLDRFWFAEAPAARLAVLRILVGSYAAWLLHFRSDAILESTLLPASQFQPVGVASLLSAPPAPHIIQALLMVSVVVSVPFVLGLAFRVTGPLFAGLLLSVLTYYASWGSVNHPDALVTAHVFVLGLTRAADATSLDALIRSRRGKARRRPTAALPDPAGAWQYGFPLKLVCAVTAMSYLLAGIAKLSASSGWGTGEGLLRQVAWDGLRKELLGKPPPEYAAWVYDHAWLFMLLAFGTLVVELGAPLVLANRRLGYAWALVSLSMHWGIYLVMGISFRYYLWGLAYASFFPLERLLLPVRWLGVTPAETKDPLTRVGAPAADGRAPIPLATPARSPEPAPIGERLRPAYGFRRYEGRARIAAASRDAVEQPALRRVMLAAALLLFAGGMIWAATENVESEYSWPAAMLIVLGGICATMFLVVDEPSL